MMPCNKNFLLLACCLFFSFLHLLANTKTWTGIAGDGKWSTPLNWSGASVPVATDDVLLDHNSVNSDYTVTMPDGPVTIKSITITPATTQTITLLIPSTNFSTPAVTTTSSGYSIVINKGGILKNSSGLTSGSSLSISDSFQINNGGRYIHNTRSSHATNIVQILSKAPGTETGIFEFDTPGTQGYTVSISNRTYGTLVLSATSSSNGTRTYTGSGSNPLNINGDLQIGVGVTLKSDLATSKGNINLNGSLIQNGGTVNLASGPDSSVLKIKGDILQSTGGIITESSTGVPAIELVGSAQQNISMQGTISDSIIFRMNNASGAVLQAPLLLPYKLELIKGNITTSSTNLLTLQAKAVVSVDSSITNTSFVNGPLRKEGLSSTDHFIFPVGKTNEFRWVELKNVTGNFNVEYNSGNAKDLSTSYSSGINHISTHGYWSIDADASPTASANVELSFANASSSGVTDMATLRASQLSSGIWMNRNNTATTGTPGASGSVVSEMITTFNSNSKQFVLASSVPNENPLPVILTSFTAVKENDEIKVNWGVASSDEIDYFEIWSSDDNNDFRKLNVIPLEFNQVSYGFSDTQILNGIRYYKLRVIQKD